MNVLSGKYRFTGRTINFLDREFHQIIAIRDVNKYVPKYTIGGYIEKTENLSDDGMCWVDADSVVGGNVHIRGNAEILNTTIICGNKTAITVEGKSVISDTKFFVQGNVLVSDSVLTNCIIAGETVIVKSVIDRSNINTSCLADCFVSESDISEAVIYNRCFHNDIED